MWTRLSFGKKIAAPIALLFIVLIILSAVRSLNTIETRFQNFAELQREEAVNFVNIALEKSKLMLQSAVKDKIGTGRIIVSALDTDPPDKNIYIRTYQSFFEKYENLLYRTAFCEKNGNLMNFEASDGHAQPEDKTSYCRNEISEQDIAEALKVKSDHKPKPDLFMVGDEIVLSHFIPVTKYDIKERSKKLVTLLRVDIGMDLIAEELGQLTKGETSIHVGKPQLAYDLDIKNKTLRLYVDLTNSQNESLGYISAYMDISSQYNIQYKQALTDIVIQTILLLGAWVIIYFLCKYIAIHPILKLTRVMKELANGNIDTEIPECVREDEIGEMAHAIEIFKENALEKKRLEEEQEKAKQRAEDEKRQAMNALAESFDSQVVGLINSLASASTQLQSTAQNMRSIAEETSQSSATVATSSEEASTNVSTVASAMEEMSASASEITSQILTARTKSNDTAQNAKNANETVNNLNELVGNIGEVVNAIQDIAEQTNLLALNATIEAARAGVAGKGFAVVAEEVKKLATETAYKTEEIKDRIIEIQNATGDSVNAMSRIICNISEIDESVTGVSAAVEEQNATISEVVRSISEASQGVHQVSEIIVEVEKRATETGLSADTVLSAAEEVSGLSENLMNSVELFLSEIRSDGSIKESNTP